jgi:NAD(P)-dependent dehydrogenase (short-subunit alcohol dehydrogenase family)
MFKIDFTNKVVLITGGTKGIGKGICEAFLSAGATVIACARTAPKTPLSVEGNAALFRKLDVCNPDAVEDFMQSFQRDFGQLDYLVNNAGGTPYKEAATASTRFSERIVALNLLAPLAMAQAANRIMQAQQHGGLIINIASVSGLRPSPGTAIYGAAKAGLINLTQSLAVEWGPKVRVNALAVGLVKTEKSHLHYGDESGIAAVAKTIPLQEMATPADIGGTCVMLTAPQSRYINGSCIAVDGGGEKPVFLDAAMGR